jgi:anaerobic selenocysteine-containing dehydrogenase
LEKNMSDKQPKASRRGFFIGAAATGAAAVAVTALSKVQQAEPVAAQPKPMPEKGGGYTVSEHVKRYYQTTLV